MKAITIHQPFAHYLANGIKRYETRSWSTDYRGLIAIHAGKTWNNDLREQSENLKARFVDVPDIGSKPARGAILAIALLEDVIPTKQLRKTISSLERAVGNYADGRYGWRLKVIERFDTPIPVRGQQGLWNWDWDDFDISKRIAVVGSRDYTDLSLVKDFIYSLPSDTTIISGGAQGVDLAAETHARERGMKVISIPVDTRNLPQHYDKRKAEFGRRAMMRNTYIVQMAGSVTAFWDGSSRGTKDSIDKAEKFGREVRINPIETVMQTELVQKQLTGFLSVYDEGVYIEQTKTKEEPSPDIEALYLWESPWRINEHWVWVFSQWEDGEKTYCPARIGSVEAKRQQRNLSGLFYSSETRSLRDWMDRQIGWVDTPNYAQQWDVGRITSKVCLQC